ncbi:MAG: hypothetical protein BHV66_09135 [Alistipes putredinis]|uniref:Uncharacterized protein n=1 Tax=Alistipes putredinis TaxID=28117 RepID=A0A1Q6F3N6_9BACT|nr:MAG: hypothetical protein BHV66_09135 [Alistipes putredinis]
MVATVCIAVMSRPVGAAGGKDGEKSARNNGAGNIRRRLSRASFTATCATKPECGLFANKIVFYLVINKEMFNFGSGGKLLPALFREFSATLGTGFDRKP